MVSCRISPRYPRSLISNHVRSVSFAWSQRFGYLVRIIHCHRCKTLNSGVGRQERGSLTTAFFTRPAQLLQGPLIRLLRVVPHPSSRTELVLSATRSRLASCPLSSLHAAPRPDQTRPILDQARKATCFCKPHNVRGPCSSPCSYWDWESRLLCFADHLS